MMTLGKNQIYEIYGFSAMIRQMELYKREILWTVHSKSLLLHYLSCH